MKTKIIFILGTLISTLFIGCSKDDELSASEQLAADITKIEAYIAENNIQGVQTTASGLHYAITTLGSGDEARVGSSVSVHYTGKFLSGASFDSSVGRNPFVFKLGEGRVISGWDEGLQKFNAGSKGVILLPSHLGYGTSGQGIIGPNEVLIFDIELIEII